jgi:NitT/TauT family transport system substrate-binding protein
MAWTTGKFRQENPKSYKAFIEALQEATTLINADKKKAAEIYRVVSNDKSSVDDILKILNQPGMQYSLTPQNIMKFAEFMHKIGSIKIKPQSWMELFFQEAHTMNGS